MIEQSGDGLNMYFTSCNLRRFGFGSSLVDDRRKNRMHLDRMNVAGSHYVPILI